MSETRLVTESQCDEVPAPARRLRIREVLHAPGGIRQAMLLMEVLSKPIALRQPGAASTQTSR